MNDVILHALEAPDRDAELHALAAVADRHLEHRLAAPDHERAEHRPGPLQRALERWQPHFLQWWHQMGPTDFESADVYLRTAISVDAQGEVAALKDNIN